MNVGEMKAKLEEYCDSVSDCELCQCVRGANGNCFSGSVEWMIANYNRVFGSTDNINHPAHYETGKFECIDVMLETQGKEAVKAFCVCNAFKYIYRHNNKNGIEDVKKAVWYLNKYIELEEDETDE